VACLVAFDRAVRGREAHAGREAWPGAGEIAMSDPETPR
jgi:hypothetical protein